MNFSISWRFQFSEILIFFGTIFIPVFFLISTVISEFQIEFLKTKDFLNGNLKALMAKSFNKLKMKEMVWQNIHSYQNEEILS